MEQSPTTLNDALSGNEVPMADFNVAVIESDPSLRSQTDRRSRRACSGRSLSDDRVARRAARARCARRRSARSVVRGPGGAGRGRAAHAVSSEVGTVLMVEALSTDVLQRALRAGVKDVLAAPVEAGELALAVERVGGSLAPAAPTALADSSCPRRLRPPRHRLLDQGRRRQVRHRRQPRGHPRSALRASGRPRRRRPPVRRRRGDAQARPAAHDRRRGQRDRQARRPAPAEPARSARPFGPPRDAGTARARVRGSDRLVADAPHHRAAASDVGSS